MQILNFAVNLKLSLKEGNNIFSPSSSLIFYPSTSVINLSFYKSGNTVKTLEVLLSL